MALEDFPRYPLLLGPCATHPMDRLTAHPGGASIRGKGEDCNRGQDFGGNFR